MFIFVVCASESLAFPTEDLGTQCTHPNYDCSNKKEPGFAIRKSQAYQWGHTHCAVLVASL